MEINTNPNYLNNVQNQNAQGANSATAENVVEENLFDGSEVKAPQNNAASQDYQNAEMLNTFVAAFTAVMAPFMQMMTQFMTTMTAALSAKDNSNPDGKYVPKDPNPHDKYVTNDPNPDGKYVANDPTEKEGGDYFKAKITHNQPAKAGIAMDEESMRLGFNRLDLNGDGIITQEEQPEGWGLASDLEGLNYEGYVQNIRKDANKPIY